MTSSVFKQVWRTASLVLFGSNLVIASSVQAMPDWLNQIRFPGSTPTQSVSQSSTTPRSTTPSSTTPSSTTPSSTPTSPAPANSQLSDVRFSCQTANGQPTVMYNPQSQPGKYYAWATPTSLGGGWTPERRCNEISRRLEFYRPDGLLELQTGVENGYNTICVTTEAMSSCRIVLTVPPGQNPVAIRDRIFNNLLVADNGEQTTAVTAYQDNGSGIFNQIGQALGINLGGNSAARRSPSSINLRPFLDAADGGTGARLQTNSTPASNSGAHLNPGNFR